MSKNKKTLFVVLGAIVLIAALLCAWYFGYYQPQQEKLDAKGEGEITITVKITHSDEQVKELTIHTSATYLSEALLEQNLMEGHEDTYGLYIDAMDGEVASASENKAWCFDKNGEMVETGVAQTILEDGSVYNFYIVTW